MSIVAKVPLTTYGETVARALDLVGAASMLPHDRLIIVKPNLTNADPPPVTTPVECVRAVMEYVRRHTGAPLAIGEGCGSGTTHDAFAANGYDGLAREFGARLIDFNTAKSSPVADPRAIQESEFYLPDVLVDAFVISIPILKDHSFTGTTIALKNMFGIAPETHYGGSWNKSRLHSPSTDAAVHDVNLYKRPELSVVDAVTALTGMHLCGTPKRFGVVLASRDPVAVDAVGSEMLGHDPHRLEYLRLCNGVHGDMDEIEIVSE